MSEKLYTTHLLRTEESILHVRARIAIGSKKNYIRVAPREVYEVTTALDKARLEIERLTAERDAAIARAEKAEGAVSEQSEIVQRDWLSPIEAIGLRVRAERAEADAARLAEVLEEIRWLPLAPETRPDLPYSLIANIDTIANEALAAREKGGEG